MGYEYLRQIADMAKAIEQQDRMNEKNVSSFLERLENAIEYDIGLHEDVQMDTEISSASSMIFGQCKVDSVWHIAIAQRDTYRDPDSDEEYVYGQLPQPILNAGSAQQREVFFKANLLISEIHKHLTDRYESSKETEEEITAKIKEVDVLLKQRSFNVPTVQHSNSGVTQSGKCITKGMQGMGYTSFDERTKI